MPKMKTNSAAKKRFKRVGTGKVKRSFALKRHILTKKTTKRKRKLRSIAYISDVDIVKMKTLLPYK